MANANNSFSAYTIHAEVEIATPREGSTRSSHLHEGMLARAFQSPEISDALLEASMEGKRRTSQIIRMLTAVDDEDYGEAPQYWVTDPLGRDKFAKDAALDESALYMSDSALLFALEEAFPEGVVLGGVSQTEGSEQVFLHFGLLASMSTVIGGTAEGLAGEAVALVCFALAPDRSGADQAIMGKIAHIQAGVEGWLSNAVKSHSILKRLMRGKKGLKLGGKIRTASHIPVLNHEAGELPKLGMSIKDDRLKELAKLANGEINPEYINEDGRFDVRLMHQAVLELGRAPMPMTTAVELVLLELEGFEGEPGTDIICGDGFGFAEPNETTFSRKMTLEEMRHLRDGNVQNFQNKEDFGFSMGWNAANEGDSDGDGDEVENAAK